MDEYTCGQEAKNGQESGKVDEYTCGQEGVTGKEGREEFNRIGNNVS